MLRLPLAAAAAIAIALSLTLAACGSSHKSTSAAATGGAATVTSTDRSAQQPLVVSVSTPRTEPVAGGLWPITVRARAASGASADGTVSYAFLFGGSVVARRPGGHMSGGVFHDRLEFPAKSVGYPLTLLIVVQGANGESGSTERRVTVRG